MQRNLDALSVDYRNVLFLVDVCEASYQEAADQLACPIGTVMSRLHRARRQLRDRLERDHAIGERATAESGQHAATAA
jgi:RNA polymerase sigma-70 factor (ECF subfamily)